MFLLSEKEGYLLVDHRDSPGLSHEWAKKARSHIAVPGGTRLEARTYTCCGCQKTVVLNPDRLRSREYCRECHSFLCDTCALVRKIWGVHRPFRKFVGKYLESVAKGPAAAAQFQLEQAIYEAQRKRAQQLVRRIFDGT